MHPAWQRRSSLKYNQVLGTPPSLPGWRLNGRKAALIPARTLTCEIFLDMRRNAVSEGLPAEVVFRGTPLGPFEVRQIRLLMANNRDRTQPEIARRVCRHFKWYRPGGDLADRGCVDALRRLQSRGLIRLPPPLRNVAISLLRLAGATNIAAAVRHCSRHTTKALRLIGLAVPGTT